MIFFITDEEDERFNPATVTSGIYLIALLVKGVWDGEFFKVEREE